MKGWLEVLVAEMAIADGTITSHPYRGIVTIINAAMPQRHVVEWEKAREDQRGDTLDKSRKVKDDAKRPPAVQDLPATPRRALAAGCR